MGNGMILHLWHVNPDLVLRGFVDVHIIDPNNMTRILDICKELKVKIGVDLVFVLITLSFSPPKCLYVSLLLLVFIKGYDLIGHVDLDSGLVE